MELIERSEFCNCPSVKNGKCNLLFSYCFENYLTIHKCKILCCSLKYSRVMLD